MLSIQAWWLPQDRFGSHRAIQSRLRWYGPKTYSTACQRRSHTIDRRPPRRPMLTKPPGSFPRTKAELSTDSWMPPPRTFALIRWLIWSVK